MNSELIAAYALDLIVLLKEKAISAKKEAVTTKGTADSAFLLGKQMAYYEVISLIQDQANAFGISLKELGLSDINPEQDLL